MSVIDRIPSTGVVGHMFDRWEEGYSKKSSMNSQWQECVDYVLPTRQSFGHQRAENQAMPRVMFDSTAVWANTQLASGLHSYLTSPTTRWFRMDISEEDKQSLNDAELEEATAWLQDATEVMYGIFNSQKTNFAPQAHELYLDLGALGTGVFYVEEDYKEAPMLFNTFHLADCVLEEDSYGRVNAFHRRFKLTGRNLLALFEKSLPEDIRKKATDKPNEKFECQHSIVPREDKVPGAVTYKGMDYASYYFLAEKKIPLYEGGYREFPIMAPRWSKLVGDIYGRSPAMMAMPDILMINAMAKTTIEGAQLAVRPPIQLPDEGFLLPIKLTPGGLNFYNSGLNPDQRIQTLDLVGNLNISDKLMDSRRQQITRSFYVDWMQLQEGPQMTATEVMQRTEDNMRMMAPSVSRLQFEFLDPLIDRVWAIATRKRLFRKPPQVLIDKNVKAMYVSPVAKAQRMTQVLSFQRMMETIIPLAQQKPEMLDRIDGDGVVDFIAEVNDVSHKILTNMDEVKSIRDKRAEGAKQGAAIQEAQGGADAALKGAKAAQTLQQMQTEAAAQ